MYKLYLRLTSGHLSWLADYARADLALEHARRLSGKLKAAVIVQFNAANSQQSQTIIFEGGRCIAHMRTSQHSSGIAGSNSGAAL